MSDTLNKVLLGASVGMGLLAAGIAFKAGEMISICDMIRLIIVLHEKLS